jgi:hypothetical protein
LRLFSDRAFLPAGAPHAVVFYPFWGKNPEDPGDPNTGRFDAYTARGGHLFSLTSVDEADVAVLPCDWSEVEGKLDALARSEEFFALAREAGRTTAVFFASDSDSSLPDEGIVTFETSLYRSRRRPAQFALPAWSEDFVARYLGGRLPVRPKGPRPVVGFCGLAPRRSLVPRRLRASAQSAVRAHALHALERDAGVDTNFIVRKRFLGGALTGGQVDAPAMHRVRREYFDNLVESDYVVCARGAGNFSYRLYETLSCGRIPVFVDTDCVLPYDFLLHWRDYCVWVEEHEVERAGERVREFHERLTDGEFQELQHSARRLWEEYLAPEGFFANFHRHFEAVSGPG